MNIGVIGSGALGSLFAAALAPLAEVTMLGHWPQQVAALRASRLEIIGTDGRRTHHSFNVVNEARQLPSLDVALVLVKAYQTRHAAAEISGTLGPGGIAITLQNGLGNRAELARVLHAELVVAGVTAQGATMIRPGLLRHAGDGPTILEMTEHSAARIAELAAILNEAGLQTSVTGEIRPHMWGKLAVNAGINPLTAILRVRNGFLAANPTARGLLAAAAQEVADVAVAEGIVLPYAGAAARAVDVAAATAENLSSMLQDVLRQAPTEIDYICGAVARHGLAAGVPTPVNDELARLVEEVSRTHHWPETTTLPGLQELLDARLESIDDRYQVN